MDNLERKVLATFVAIAVLTFPAVALSHVDDATISNTFSTFQQYFWAILLVAGGFMILFVQCCAWAFARIRN